MEKDLNKVCLMINKLLFSLYGDELKFSLESDVAFDDLCIQFEESLNEEDMECFIRKCADFYFDFLKVCPFGKENDKISMVLLTIMLATRNIMLPILYNDTYEKDEFFENSGIFVSDDYSVIEQYLFEKLACYYPSVMLPLPKISKCYRKK